MRIVPTTFRFLRLERCCLAAIVAVQVTSASAAPPAPPAHKHRQSVTPQTRDADPSTTATIPPKAASQKPPPLQKPIPDPTAPDNDALPPPFHLPTASRERMRDCGLKWQAMKASGEAGEEIWRDFATRCLAAASGPLDKHSER